MAATAWTDRPDLRPWCARLLERAARWRPHPTLGIDVRPIVDAVAGAAAAAAPWLVHPCMNALTFPTGDCRLERDVRVITWVAAHTRTAVGAFTLEYPSWRWSADGRAVPVPAGRHDLASLVAGDSSLMAHDASATHPTIRDPIIDDTIDPTDPVVVPAIAVDPFCRSTGLPLPLSWIEPLTPAEASLVDMAVREIGHALALFARTLPACAKWAAAVTRVLVPLQHDGTTWSSGSQPEIPGLIHVSGLHGPVAALEGLVHESAHHHFTMREANAPLIDPAHENLYPSPLRSAHRPLRSVFLAVHALRHIVAFYDDGLEAGLLSPDWRGRRDHAEGLLDQGLTTLVSARPHFTSSGDMVLSTLIGD
jgi:HEXXH motif-containing protein